MAMTTWLKDHLLVQGHLTESGFSRRVQPRRCPSCRAEVLRGLDGDILAFEVTADPEPLSVLGEALALLEARRTVALNQEAGRYLFNIRWRDHIKGRPAGTGFLEDVVRTHRCGTAHASGALTAPSNHAAASRVRLPANAPAPF